MDSGDSSVNIALKHIKTASVFLILFFCYMMIDSTSFLTYFFMNTKIIALTHILTLGFLLMVIMGASYMLLPVALGVKIAFDKIFYYVYYGYAASLIIFVAGMHYFNTELIAFGGILLFISVLIYDINIMLSLKKIRKWDYTSFGVLFAYIYLFIGISAGAYMAVSFYYNSIIGKYIFDSLTSHIYIMSAGFIVMLFIAISYRLLPMFYMTKKPGNFIWITDFILLNSGIILIIISSIVNGFYSSFGQNFFYVGDFLLSAGIILFSFEFYRLMNGRIKKKLDITIFYLYAGILFLLSAVFIGNIILFLPARAIAENQGIYYMFGFIGLFGYAGMAIIGFLHKIFPFLISLKKFEKVKKGAYKGLIGNMQKKYLQYFDVTLFIAAIPIMSFALLITDVGLIRILSVILAAASLIFFVNLLIMEKNA
jgi:hypothetical protein